VFGRSVWEFSVMIEKFMCVGSWNTFMLDNL